MKKTVTYRNLSVEFTEGYTIVFLEALPPYDKLPKLRIIFSHDATSSPRGEIENKFQLLHRWLGKKRCLGVSLKALQHLRNATDGSLALGYTEMSKLRVPGEIFPVKDHKSHHRHRSKEVVGPPLPTVDENADWEPNSKYHHPFLMEDEV